MPVAFMPLFMRTGLVFLCGVLTSGILTAGTIRELEALQTGYAAEKTQINNAYEQQKTNALTAYRRSVASQMTAAKNKGDLDNYLVLKAEKDRLDTQATVYTNDAPALESLVAQYQKALQTAASSRDKALVTALRQQVGRLTTLMQNYTRTDRLNDAKIVRDEMRGAKTELTFLEADTPEETSTPTPPTPTPTTPATPTPTSDLPKNILGTWKLTWQEAGGRPAFDILLFEETGTVYHPKERQSQEPIGRWEVKNKQFFVHLAEKEITLNINATKMMLGHNRQGNSVTAVKIAEWEPFVAK